MLLARNMYLIIAYPGPRLPTPKRYNSLSTTLDIIVNINLNSKIITGNININNSQGRGHHKGSWATGFGPMPQS